MNAAIECTIVDGQGIIDAQVSAGDFGIDGHVSGLMSLRVTSSGFVEVIEPQYVRSILDPEYRRSFGHRPGAENRPGTLV